MISNLKDYEPKEVQYVLSDNVKDVFPMELDFTNITYKGKKIKTAKDAMGFVSKEFNATYPNGETVERKLDDFEVSNIREEYCVKCENDLPLKEQELEETLERIKALKKHAEEALAAVRMEIAKYAAQVKQGTTEIRLRTNETFCIALAGYYVYYTYDRNKQKFVLAKGFEVSDRSELWSQEETNRKTMHDYFNLDFPEAEKPTEDNKDEEGEKSDADNLPFADEEDAE
jgi:hypothetical protein